MSITDELREWFKDRIFMANGWQEIHDIADRIDAEHEAACAEAYGNGVMSVPIALDESQWVKLPLDADGVPIRVGDVVEWCDSGDTLTVEGIGKDIVFYIENEGAEWTAARNKRHHAPTVEDVLRGVVELCHNTWKEGSAFEFYDVDDVMKSGNIAEYAAKLQLRGGAE